ncbi:hypothetical protein MJO28_016956 [Puccinia striiformis f. sp. tritici]|nr:hypothetical protein MJO28_016956 [Puccinia striiformis f. sp. tritici]
MTKSVFRGKMSKDVAISFLESAGENLVLLANTWGALHKITLDPTAMVKQIPISQDAVFNRLGLKPILISEACCKKFFAMYPTDSNTARYLVPQSDEDLWRTNSRGKRKPQCTFNYMALKIWLNN